MSVAIAAVAAIAVVVVILLTVAFWIVEMGPFVHHREQYRDAHGRRIGSAPRLD
jgi:hypothetical protein